MMTCDQMREERIIKITTSVENANVESLDPEDRHCSIDEYNMFSYDSQGD